MSTYNGKIKVVKARPRSKRLRDIGGAVSTVTSSREVVTAPSVDLSRYMVKEAFDELFEKVNLGTAEVPHWAIKAKLSFFTVGWLSFNGPQIGDGSASDTPVAGAQNLADLKDVSLGNILPGQVLSWNGNKWVNSTLATSGFDELQLSQYLTSHNYVQNSDLAGYATESWVLQKLQSVGADDLFEKINLGTELAPVWAIKAKYNLYTVGWLSFRGPQVGGGDDTPATIASNLADLKDVDLDTLAPGQVLAWSGTKWTNTTPATSGFDESSIADYLASHNYATHQWVNTQGFLKQHQALAGYATESWVNDQGFLTQHQSLAGYATESWVNDQNFATQDALGDYYNKTQIDTALGSKLDAATFDDLFAKVNLGTDAAPLWAIKAKHNLYTVGWLSFNGANIGDGGSTSFGLGNLGDVALATPLVAGQVLAWSGTKWVNSTIATSGIDEASLADYLSTHGYATQSWANGAFVSKAGDTMTGSLKIKSGLNTSFELDNTASSGTESGLVFRLRTTNKGWVGYSGGRIELYSYATASYLGIKGDGTPVYNTHTLLHTGNYTSTLDSRYVLKSGDTMTDNLLFGAPDKGVRFNHAGVNGIWGHTSDNAATNQIGSTALSNLVIASHWGIAFISTCTGATYVDKVAVGIDTRNGTMAVANWLKASHFLTNTTTLCTNLNADLLDGLHGASYMRDNVLGNVAMDANALTTPYVVYRPNHDLNTNSNAFTNFPYKPEGGFSLLNFLSGNYRHQLWLGYGDNHIYVRCTYYSGGVGVVWADWSRLALTTDTVANAESLGGIAAADYVTRTTTQDITGIKHFMTETYFTASGLTYADPWQGVACAIKVTGKIGLTDSIKAASFIKNGGTSDQILLADGNINAKINATGATTLNWQNDTISNSSIPTMALLAYWDGRYTGTSNTASNLKYCNQGAFGSIVTRSYVDYGYASALVNMSLSGNAANITTAQFISKLTALGAFGYRKWSVKNTWAYANNDVITDTGCGNIQLAGAVVEVFANGTEQYFIRVTTSPVSTGGAVTNAVYVYRYNGTTYSPNWQRLANFSDVFTRTEADNRYARALYGNEPPTGDINNFWSNRCVLGSIHISANAPAGNGWYNIVQIAHRNGSGDGPSFVGQIALGMTVNLDQMYFRGHRTRAWQHVLTEQNYAGYLDSHFVTLATTQTIGGFKTVTGVSGTGANGFNVGMRFTNNVHQSIEVESNGNTMGLGCHSNGSWYWWYGNTGGKNYCMVFNGALWSFHGQMLVGQRCHINQEYISFNRNNATGAIYDSAKCGAQIGINNTIGGIELATHTGTAASYAIRMLIGAHTGNVGIGTASPQYKAHVVGDILADGGWLRTSGAKGWYNNTYGGGWWMQGSTYIENYGSKRIKISGINDYYAVWIAGGGLCCEGFAGTSWGSGHGALNVGIANNEAQTPLLLAYRVGAGTAGASRLFDMELLNNGGELRWHFAGNMRFRFLSTGEFYASKGIWTEDYLSFRGQNASSDGRFKDIQSRITLPLAVIANAPSVIYRWVDNGKMDMGSIAQYWQKHLPLAVGVNPLGRLGMDYSKIALASAITIAQSLMTTQDDVKILKSDVKRLTAENQQLKTEISQLKTKIAA